MAARRSLLLVISYGFFATLTVFYGLVERQSLFATFVSFHLIACLAIPIFHAYYWEGTLSKNWRRAWGTCGFRKPAGLLLGISSGCLLFMVILYGLQLLFSHEVHPLFVRQVLEHWGLQENWLWFFVFYIIVINSLLEEVLWRGFVLERLLMGTAKRKALVLSSFFYSFYHFILGSALFGVKWGLLVTVLVFAVGVFWGWMKLHHQTVYPTWISHMLADAGIMAALLRYVF